ncbi:MAG: nitroreductase family protein [Puniceicoccales bacterium]|nr:nitroreductase family protein [Puniceicoccales bacterium]
MIYLFVFGLFMFGNVSDAAVAVLSKKYDKVGLENQKNFHSVGSMDAILNRRSIRSYTSEPVNGEHVSMILKAGFSAPSAMGSKPWHFIVVDDRVILDRLAEKHHYAGMLRSAPLAVLVCGDKSLESIPDKFEQNCSAATENILIAATALGLGSVWVGCYPDVDVMKGFRMILNIPEKIFPFAIVPLGHPLQTLSPRDNYDSERVHLNGW